MIFCLEAWCIMSKSLHITTVKDIVAFCDILYKKSISELRLRLLLTHQIRNSPGSLCKIITMIFISLPLYLNLIYNKLENPASQRYMVCWKRKKKAQHSLRTGSAYKHLIRILQLAF